MQSSPEIPKQFLRMSIWLLAGPTRASSRAKASRQSWFRGNQEQERLSPLSTAWRWSPASATRRATLFRKKYLLAILYWRLSETARQSETITPVASGNMCKSSLGKITLSVGQISSATYSRRAE
jgi:hypothetical protein